MGNSFKRWISAVVAVLCICSIVGGCVDGGPGRRSSRQTRLHFQIIEEAGVSRSNWFSGETVPEDILVLFFHTDGILAGWTAPGSRIDTDGNYTLEDIAVDCDYYIYALAGIDIDESRIPTDFGSMEAAERFTVLKSEIQAGRMPYACIPDAAVHVERGGCYEVRLERLLAKYSFAMDVSELTGTFTATSVTVKQSPLWTRPLLPCNSATGGTELSDGDRATSGDIATFNEGGLFCCYLLENCQGEVNPGNSDPWLKVPEEMQDGKGSLASYVEICGNYAGDNISISGLRYRFFLGNDAFSDCNVRRNTAHSVILHLTDSNTILKESWKVVRGSVEDNRTLDLSESDIDIFPYPGRKDTVHLNFSPSNLHLKVSLDSSRLASYPFSVSLDGDRLIIDSERFLQEDATTLLLPVCVGTRDNVRRDTVNVAYYSLDHIWLYEPFNLYTNFIGNVYNEDNGMELGLTKNTFTDRRYNFGCFKVDLDYNGVTKSCWSDIFQPDRDTVFETGLVLESSDPDIVSVHLSTTNPTLWYLQAENPGTSRVTASYTMGETIESGYKDYSAHVLSAVLNVRPSIGLNESCEPEVVLYNETGTRFLPYGNQAEFYSANTFILSNDGIGLSNGTTRYGVKYGGSDDVADSREVTVSGADNRYELYILPEDYISLYPGESCGLTARCRHYLNGTLISDEAVSCFWNNYDHMLQLNTGYGDAVTAVGAESGTRAAVVSATFIGDGYTCSAEKQITVLRHLFFTDSRNLEWTSAEYGDGAVKGVELTASPTLSWNAVLYGADADCFNISASYGNGPARIEVCPASENTSRERNRTATLVIRAGGMADQKVYLKQMRDTTALPVPDPEPDPYPIPDPNPNPDPIPDPTPDPVPDPVIHDTTFVLSITPEGTVSLPHHGTCQFTAYLQMLVDGIADGNPEDVTARAEWHTSRRYAAEIEAGGLAQGCNGTPDPETTEISATLDSLTSNTTILSVGGLVRRQYLELTPSSPQTIEADGSIQYTLILHTVTDGIDNGGVDITLSADWTSSNTGYARAAGGVVTGCNTTFEQQRVVISGHHSNLTAQAYLYVNGLTPPEPETHTLAIETSRTGYFLDRDASGETITVLYDGLPVSDASAISWNSSNSAVISGVSQFRPAFCGTGSATLCATYNGETSNTLEYQVNSRISSARFSITSLTIREGNGYPVTYPEGNIPQSRLKVVKSSFSKGESGTWCTMTGGSFTEIHTELTVALYVTDVNGMESYVTTKTFPFAIMRGDLIDFNTMDWKGFIDRKYFNFTARIVVD